MRPKIGLQLYTVRDWTQKDFAGVLQRVADLGYEGVEFAGYGGLDARTLRSLLRELGLMAPSSHVPLADLEGRLDESLEYAQAAGIERLVCPWLPAERRTSLDDYRRLAELLSEIGLKCAEAGLSLCYHNHDFEFEFQDRDGEFALDLLFRETSPDRLQTEIDAYWVEYAGHSAEAYLRRYDGRSPLLHIKDMEHGPGRHDTDLGRGALDIPGLLQTAEKVGTEWCFVERDNPQDSLQSATDGLLYLKGIGALSRDGR